jgi:hypothetical protein
MSQAWGPAGPAGRGRRSRRPLILAGVAVAALGSGAGVALAATPGPSSPAGPASDIAASPSPSPSGQLPAGRQAWHRFGHPGARPGFGPGSFRPGGGLGPGGGLLGALHGQIVVAKPGGGYQTIDIQRGQVTAVSDSSITLKSADGFSKAYAVRSSTIVDAQRGGISSVKVGNQATVLATVSGGAATATRIADTTLLQAGRPSGFPRGHSGQSGGTAG